MGIPAAISTAWSMSRASIKMTPPNCSFVSANGPSVLRTLPPRTFTVRAVLGSSPLVARGPANRHFPGPGHVSNLAPGIRPW